MQFKGINLPNCSLQSVVFSVILNAFLVIKRVNARPLSWWAENAPFVPSGIRLCGSKFPVTPMSKLRFWGGGEMDCAKLSNGIMVEKALPFFNQMVPTTGLKECGIPFITLTQMARCGVSSFWMVAVSFTLRNKSFNGLVKVFLLFRRHITHMCSEDLNKHAFDFRTKFMRLGLKGGIHHIAHHLCPYSSV